MDFSHLLVMLWSLFHVSPQSLFYVFLFNNWHYFLCFCSFIRFYKKAFDSHCIILPVLLWIYFILSKKIKKKRRKKTSALKNFCIIIVERPISDKMLIWKYGFWLIKYLHVPNRVLGRGVVKQVSKLLDKKPVIVGSWILCSHLVTKHCLAHWLYLGVTCFIHVMRFY